jgi:hypothetical protein
VKQLQYFITAVWGILTPAFAFDGAQQLVAVMKNGANAQGNPTPTEYVLLLVLSAGGCVLAFLLFNALFSAFALPKDKKRFLYFILNVLLYLLAVPLGWLAMTMLVPALGLL